MPRSNVNRVTRGADNDGEKNNLPAIAPIASRATADSARTPVQRRPLLRGGVVPGTAASGESPLEKPDTASIANAMSLAD
jgi:hypothetical protein